LTGGDHVFVGVPGAPHTAGLLTELSRKTILQTNPALEQITRNDFTRKLAAGADYAGLRGAGASGEPTGILTDSDISEETIAAGAVTWTDVLNLIAQVLGADVRGGSFGFTFNAFVQAYLRSTLKVSGDAAAAFIMDSADRLAGYPVAITSQMAGTTGGVDGVMLGGDFSEVILAFWGDAGADILVNPFDTDAYKRGNVKVRGLIDMDVLIRHPEGFCKIEGIDLGGGS
jgi:HK97 family phage major capsid protein